MHTDGLIQARRKIDPNTELGTGVTTDLMRLSIGLEDADDPMDDH